MRGWSAVSSSRTRLPQHHAPMLPPLRGCLHPPTAVVRILALSAAGSPALGGREAFAEMVKFSRPHTMIGTGISVLSLSAWAAPSPTVGLVRMDASTHLLEAHHQHPPTCADRGLSACTPV